MMISSQGIIIPNPVMSPEGPVYSGPTNIYLAYPVQGPDGRGYITQPFSGPSYSPGSGSCDSTNCYSSTPHTPNSGQDSGSSTQPTSPPPLVNYHPSNWVRPTPVAANGQLPQEEKRPTSPLTHVPAFLPRNMPARHQQQDIQENGRGGPLSHHDGPRVYQPQQHQQQQHHQQQQQQYQQQQQQHQRGPRSPRAAEQQLLQQLQQQNGLRAPELPSTPTVTYIPGLPAESSSPKKTAKRRKKKKNEPTNLGRDNGHRGSTSSESEVRVPEDTVQIHLTNGEVQQLQLSTGEVEEVERKQEEVQELHLTDDLADSLMNPPTEPEQSDEEPSHCTHKGMKIETEEVLLEDQEVQGITEAVESWPRTRFPRSRAAACQRRWSERACLNW